ncbi:neural cell adhesion molecule 1-like [Dendronephthya gigantea]|uniref:neural cell adhesion molecule 1-like n=1 Tax=Dendronephthya gigantea TaxID=151771 RepID=UPI00106D9672|nr:neural cell adhesion molecule 1-like [Dendronephthya gigantea]
MEIHQLILPGLKMTRRLVEEERKNTVERTAKPTVTFSCPDTTTLNEGDDFSCLCEGKNGSPAADVTWFKDGEQIGGTGKKEQLLTLKNVDKSDSGTYKCVAESDSNERYKDEKTMKIIVQFKPRKPELTFTSNLAPLGGSFTISCSSDGVPEPSYKITHNCTEVSTEKSLTISSVKWSDAGRYECFVNNNLGNDSVSKDLKVTAFQVDSTYQELDLKKMNKEDNYQSLSGNVAGNDGVNNDESNYAELNKTRDVENNYQSLS